MMGKKVLTIEGRRDCYSIDQMLDCVGTMTVGELISELEGYDEDMPVMLNNDNGYTYGAFTSYGFEIEEADEDEDEEEELEDDEDDEDEEED